MKNREQRGNEEAGPYRRLTAHPRLTSLSLPYLTSSSVPLTSPTSGHPRLTPFDSEASGGYVKGTECETNGRRRLTVAVLRSFTLSPCLLPSSLRSVSPPSPPAGWSEVWRDEGHGTRHDRTTGGEGQGWTDREKQRRDGRSLHCRSLPFHPAHPSVTPVVRVVTRSLRPSLLTHSVRNEGWT